MGGGGCSVAQLCPTIRDTMDCSIPVFPVLHYFPEFAQTHVHWVDPLLLMPSIFPGTKVFSNVLGLCIRWPKYWSFSLASVLPVNIQSWFPLGLTDLISLQSKGLSRVFARTTVWKYQFFGAQPSLWFSCHPYRTLDKP